MVLLGGRDAGYVAPLLAQRSIPVLLTSVLASPSRPWEAVDREYSLPGQLHRAGVRVGIAGTSAAQYANRLPYEAGAAIAFGLPADEALRAVTLNPAQFLGFDDRVGSLEVGKDATLLITTGSPLEYATLIEQAFIEGRMIDMEDSHRRFFEKYSEKLRQLQPRGGRPRRPGPGPGLHRHPLPHGPPAAARPPRGQQGAAGRHHRGGGPGRRLRRLVGGAVPGSARTVPPRRHRDRFPTMGGFLRHIDRTAPPSTWPA
jgi:hypothetical protein